MAPKSRYIGARFEPAQQRKLITLSLTAGEPGNMSAALRWLVDRENISNEAISVQRQTDITDLPEQYGNSGTISQAAGAAN